jgi:iron-sulfur cluster repair protein YtfE (RIC family)
MKSFWEELDLKNKLTEELHHEHQILAEKLTQVKKLGPTEEGLKILQNSKAALIAHLKKEDAFLYPELRRMARQDSRMKEIVDNFAADMEMISAVAIQFFVDWENGGDPEDFGKELDTLIAVLLGRIRREETILYPEYNLGQEKKVA